MQADLVVRNGILVTPEGMSRGGVAIHRGRIAALGSDRALPRGREELDVEGNHILPGLIDAHVHFRDPGFTHKEDFETGSRAAASGGITMVIDMPINDPPTATLKALEQKKRIAGGKSIVDFGLLGVVLPTNLEEFPRLARAGAIGLKLFMGETVGALPAPDDGMMLECFKVIARTGLRVGIHAENVEITRHETAKLKAAGRSDPLAFVSSRPEISEAEAISRAILFTAHCGNKLHVHHLSSKQGLELVRAAKARGLDVTAETGPQYLLLDSRDMRRLGSSMKINPPIRDRSHQERLWEGVLDGGIDMIATDHSPHSPEEKLKDNIFDAIAGFCGVETGVPLMLTQVNKGRLSLQHYVRLASENPARVWGLYPRKGSLRVGSAGDLTVVDMNKKGVIRSRNLHSKTKVTPFEGFRVKGMPICTIVRGHVVMRRGELTETPIGRMVIPNR